MSVDFTIVIPTFRRPKELRDAISSVLAQTGATFELFVVDDCPDGSARSAVEAFADPRISYERNPHPTGGVPSVVRNLAWPRAKGTFIHFLDDDDMVPEGHYAAVKEAFAAHPEAGMVFGRIEPFGACPPKQLAHEKRFFARAARNAGSAAVWGSKWAFVSRMLFGWPLLVCSAGVIRRDCVERIGGFDPTIHLLEDTDFYVRVMREAGAVFVDRVTLKYRIGYPSLLHAPSLSPETLALLGQGRRLLLDKYKRERGALEYFFLSLFARTLLKVV